MILTFEKIREVQLSEKKEELQKLPESFYEDCVEYMSQRMDSDEGRSAQRILSDLFERRMRKMVNLASLYFPTNRTPENMGEHELRVYNEIVNLLKKSDLEFRKFVYVDKAAIKNCADSLETPVINAVLKPHSEPAENVKVPSDNSKIRVTFISDTPELMLPDMNSCTFKKGDHAELPKSFADFLIKKGFAQ